MLQVRAGLNGGIPAVLIIDLVERRKDDGDGARLQLSLDSMENLLTSVVTSAVDEVGAVVFPLLSDGPIQLAGPNVEIQFGDRSLDQVLHIPPTFTRPEGAHSAPGADIRVPDGADALDCLERGQLIRRGMVSMLRQNGYDNVETWLGVPPT
jgi:hypothetical protein